MWHNQQSHVAELTWEIMEQEIMTTSDPRPNVAYIEFNLSS